MTSEGDGRTRRERFEPRLKRRLSVGLLVGALVGGLLGLFLGLMFLEGRPGAIIACASGGVAAGLLYGALVGSFAGLESPDPGDEPSETAHPLSEPAIDAEDEHDLSRSRRRSDGST